MDQLVIDVDGNRQAVVRFKGGYRIGYKTVSAAIKNAARHVAQFPDSYDPNPIVVTAAAAARLVEEPRS